MKKEKIYQNKFINTLLLFDSKESEFEDGNEREYKFNDDLYVYVSVPDTYYGKYTIDDFQFSCTTRRLLVFLIMKFTNMSEDERQTGEIEFTVREFMELCNLKDRDNTKRSIEKDLFTLFCVRCEWQGYEVFLLEDYKNGRGKFVVTLHEVFANLLMSKKGIVLLPYSYFEIQINKFSEAPGWLYFLVCQELINSRHTNKNRISVNSLLVRSSLMRIDEIRQTSNCSVKERVIVPFFRNLNLLSSVFDLKFFDKKGNEITPYKLQSFNYDELIKVIIHYEIK